MHSLFRQRSKNPNAHGLGRRGHGTTHTHTQTQTLLNFQRLNLLPYRFHLQVRALVYRLYAVMVHTSERQQSTRGYCFNDGARLSIPPVQTAVPNSSRDCA